MNKFLDRGLRMAFGGVANRYVRRARTRMAIHYGETIQATRKAVMVIGALIFCALIMAGGAILIPLALCLLMPWQPETKALVICAFGAVYLLGSLVVTIVLMSEGRWMRMAGVQKLLKDVLSKQ